MSAQISAGVGSIGSHPGQELLSRRNEKVSIEKPFPGRLAEIIRPKRSPFLELTLFSLVSEKKYLTYDKASIRGFDDMSCRVPGLVSYKSKTSPEQSEIIDYHKQ